MSEGRRRISTIYSILCKWRVEGSPEEEVKRKGGRRREGKGKTEGKVERVIRASVDRSFFHLRILISRWKKRERANETIRRGRRKRRNPIYKMSLSLSFSHFLSRALSGYPGPKIFSSLPRVLQKERRENHFSHRMSRPFPTPSFEELEKVRAEWFPRRVSSRAFILIRLDAIF